MKYYIYSTTKLHTEVYHIAVTQDVKQIYRDIMTSSSFKIKMVKENLTSTNVSKKEFYLIIKSINILQAYRFVEKISKNDSLLAKNKSDFNITAKQWKAFKKVDQDVL